jgi:hypothetical protein
VGFIAESFSISRLSQSFGRKVMICTALRLRLVYEYMA